MRAGSFWRSQTGTVAVVTALMAPSSTGVFADTATASTSGDRTVLPAVAAKTVAPRPDLKASASSVEEGSRVTLTATVRTPRRAIKVALQKRVVALYTGTPSWQIVKNAMVNGRRRVTFHRTAVDENSERYRVTLTYKRAKKPVASVPVVVTVWRWIPLSKYRPYYEAPRYEAVFGTTTINGRAYTGWGAASYSHIGSWESRFTPGRHCKAFKAVLGVADISADGSSGQVAFTADDKPAYTSPPLTPGMSVPVKVALANPHRFGIQLTDTTPGGTTGLDDIEAWPVLGEPTFLCTGVYPPRPTKPAPPIHSDVPVSPE